ncbi:hypothetical protein LMG27952_00931 [Paraburkholderia hiiakae]|uniref:Uncharacterized protein n=1 Tax=Paraburkholderia hiiakae TaxID=1081782 RepID=A0ABM8ND90_9BURK|nr:hypothetical protein [Paraburkholderia hiiakae]CAD6517992.1 hypothetical protein LMG27952_00931 [Paraburkholderia hiiakae]
MRSKNSAMGVKDYMLRYARDLADSGRYADWRAIEALLRLRYGEEQSDRLLNDASVRGELDRRCQHPAHAGNNIEQIRR